MLSLPYIATQPPVHVNMKLASPHIPRGSLAMQGRDTVACCQIRNFYCPMRPCILGLQHFFSLKASCIISWDCETLGMVPIGVACSQARFEDYDLTHMCPPGSDPDLEPPRSSGRPQNLILPLAAYPRSGDVSPFCFIFCKVVLNLLRSLHLLLFVYV
jgi:hypothetical protein